MHDYSPAPRLPQNMIQYQKDHGVKAAAVIGGGLLGLEAAKAMYDLGMETHIIEYAPILMCRQVLCYPVLSVFFYYCTLHYSADGID